MVFQGEVEEKKDDGMQMDRGPGLSAGGQRRFCGGGIGCLTDP
jgi:hypothetical protein